MSIWIIWNYTVLKTYKQTSYYDTIRGYKLKSIKKELEYTSGSYWLFRPMISNWHLAVPFNFACNVDLGIPKCFPTLLPDDLADKVICHVNMSQSTLKILSTVTTMIIFITPHCVAYWTNVVLSLDRIYVTFLMIFVVVLNWTFCLLKRKETN